LPRMTPSKSAFAELSAGEAAGMFLILAIACFL
jgi:hypothetical protein